MKVPKDGAGYRPAEPKGPNCGWCRHMEADGSCERVVGMVDPRHVCNLFAQSLEKRNP